jgi:hypothetical protein
MTDAAPPSALRLRLDERAVRTIPSPSPYAFPPFVDALLVDEVHDFNTRVGVRYAAQLATEAPRAARFARRHPHPRYVDDAELLRLCFETALQRLLCPTLDPVDLAAFEGLLDRPGRYYKLDASPLAVARALPGMYVAPTVTLLHEAPDGARRVVATRVHAMTLTAADGEAWRRARYFVAYALSMIMVSVPHVPMHFGHEVAWPLLRRALPATHPWRQLLAPHFRFTLPLSFGALYSGASVTRQRPWRLYSPFAMDEESVLRLFEVGCTGLEGNSAYPRYRFPLHGPAFVGDYGAFHRAYHAAFVDFASRFVAACPPDDAVRGWCSEVAALVPGFPDGDAPALLLAKALGALLWNVTIGHAADHHSFGAQPIERLPQRLRVPPPTSRDAAPVPDDAWGTPLDMARLYLCWKMFYADSPASTLMTTRYDFARGDLQVLAARHLDALREVERTLAVRRFIPLDAVSASIQY